MTRAPLPHTADTGVEATASTFTELVEELAMGMFESMAVIDCSSTSGAIETVVQAPTRDDLVVDALSELLYLSETEDLHLCRVRVTQEGDDSLRIEASGVSYRDLELTGPPIKAVTYHQLELTRSDDGWSARVYFDV